MIWYLSLTLILGGVVVVMALGVPVAFAFLVVTTIGVYALQGGSGAFLQLILSIYSSVSSYALVPIPLFILMGVVLWHSNIGQQAVDAIDKWIGRVPGRLSLLTIASGSVFSALSGSTMANTAMLGSLLMPQMTKRGYSLGMSMGPIMAGGGLAMMIPPSALAVILASIGKISIAKVLIAAIVPGILMAILYTIYIVIRAVRRPDEAPSYTVAATSTGEKLLAVAKYLLPLGLIIFSVSGLIVLGVATPNEAAALGAISSLLLAAAYRKLTWSLLKKSLLDSVKITAMTFAIMAAATGFSQILAFSGATRGLLDTVLGLQVSPIVLVIGMNLIVLFLGCFMDQIAIMLITLPIFMPIVNSLGLDPIWFAIIMLVNLETALMTPPFGLLLFIMKGVAPANTTFGQIYASAMPYVLLNIVAMALLIAFPTLVSSVLASLGLG
ncbi:MAG: TRAP transporter large permease subunit [Nitrospirota bacterium]